ncbi:MAG: hypothetical protein M3Z06_02975, partial [Actinomycetota bacterium]|nr:hypothetical protein [Actinomycetota bacterium]
MTHLSTLHPLDPLSAEEITATTAAVRAADQFQSLSERWRVVTIDLCEPPKDALLAWTADPGGNRLTREAEVVLLDRGDGSTHEVVVGLDDESGASVASWRRRDDVQPMAVVTELMEAETLVKQDDRFRAALAKRGVENFDAIQIDAWPAGNFGHQ